MLKRPGNSRSCLAGGAAADGIHDHHHNARLLHHIVDVGRCAALTRPYVNQLLAHRCDEVFGIRHNIHYMSRETLRAFCRRLTISGVAMGIAAVNAQRGLDQFTLPAPPCKDDLTPATGSGSTYRAGAPIKSSLVEPGITGVRISISGYVTGLSCGR